MNGRRKVPAPQTAPLTRPPAPAKKGAPPTPTPESKAGDKGDDFSETPVSAGSSVAAPAPGSMPLTKRAPKPTSGGFNPKLLPGLNEPGFDPPSLTLSPDFFRLPQGEQLEIDWIGLRQPFQSRGIPLTDGDRDMLEQNWRFTYDWMLGLGLGRGLATTVANFGTPMAYDALLQRDFPDTELRLDRAFEKLLPAGQRLPGKLIVPLINPERASWIVKKVFKKNVDFRF